MLRGLVGVGLYATASVVYAHTLCTNVEWKSFDSWDACRDWMSTMRNAPAPTPHMAADWWNAAAWSYRYNFLSDRVHLVVAMNADRAYVPYRTSVGTRLLCQVKPAVEAEIHAYDGAADKSMWHTAYTPSRAQAIACLVPDVSKWSIRPAEINTDVRDWNKDKQELEAIVAYIPRPVTVRRILIGPLEDLNQLRMRLAEAIGQYTL